MTLFGFLAAAFIVAALLFVLRPLLRKPSGGGASTRAVNLAVYRDQFAELERDLKLGTLDSLQYEGARAELQKRLLEEVGEGGEVVSSAGRGNRMTALLIALTLPAAAAALYVVLGQPQGIGAAKRSVPDAAPVSAEEFKVMTQTLAERMRQNPSDAVGWVMLGRAYKSLERYPDAVDALAKAYALQPADAEVMIEYAEALGQMSGSLQGQPRQLLDKALTIAPNDAKALTMAGGAAFEAKQYARAIAFWEKLSIQVPKDSELGKALASGIERARALQAGDAGQPPVASAVPSPASEPAMPSQAAISGRVTLSQALKDNVAPNDTVFIFARSAQGPRMPLAIVRKQVKDLPAAFSLDDSTSMNEQARLSQAGDVVITARISRSGSAMPASGDLQGESAVVKPGAEGVAVSIDQVVP